MKAASFEQALAGLLDLLAQDRPALAARLEPVLLDAIDNGLAQKFEYTIELCWKAIKEALREREGIDVASPKKAVKAWYLAGHLTEDDYLALDAALDDRNRLSHVYGEAEFQAILERVPDHARAMKHVLGSLRAD